MFCKHCGAEIADEAVICVKCGKPGAEMPGTVSAENDKPSTGLNILSFFIPLVGLILYLTQKNQYPVKAKALGKWALIGWITGIVLTIVYTVFISTMFASLMY